jgi:hypothetical protein
MDNIRRGKGTNNAAHAVDELPAQVLGIFLPLHECDIGVDALALDGVLIPHHCRLRTLGVGHQGGLHLGGANPVGVWV